MHAEDCACSFSDKVLDQARVDLMRVRIDVAKYRDESLPEHSMNSSDKSKRWDDDLTSQVHPLSCQLQGDGPVCASQAMLYSKIFREGRLKFLDNRPTILTIDAPSTLRIPISLVFCSAINVTRPNKPKQDMIIAIAAKK